MLLTLLTRLLTAIFDRYSRYCWDRYHARRGEDPFATLHDLALEMPFRWALNETGNRIINAIHGRLQTIEWMGWGGGAWAPAPCWFATWRPDYAANHDDIPF